MLICFVYWVVVSRSQAVILQSLNSPMNQSFWSQGFFLSFFTPLHVVEQVLSGFTELAGKCAENQNKKRNRTVHNNAFQSIKSYLVFVRQDYQEEISVAQENKQQLQMMGERLARASQDSKAAEIQHKLSKVSERWQHLLDLIAARWVYKTRSCTFLVLVNENLIIITFLSALLVGERDAFHSVIVGFYFPQSC